MSDLLLSRLARGPLIADGAMGTMLFARGVSFDQCFDDLNRTQPELIESIHREYLLAGAELIETNTFGANPTRLASHGLEEHARVIARQGVRIARAAREVVGVNALVAGSMGPLGKPLEPFGTITTAQAEASFRVAAEGLVEGGADALILETFQDLNEILAAIRAIRGVTASLPVIAMMTFGVDGRTQYGHTPELVVRALVQAGVGVVGINCGVGPQPTLELLQQIVAAAGTVPVAAMPNAGLPQYVDGRFVYLASPEYFAEFAVRAIEAGVRIAGGCCGTTPAHIKAIRERLESHLPAEKLAPGAEVRVIEPAPVADDTAAESSEPTLLRKLREKFVVSVEVDPPRGISTRKVMDAVALMDASEVDCINIADSPLARIRMSAMSLAALVRARFPRLEIILHFTTRDRNLMGLQSDLLGAHALGIPNILCLKGDPPSLGDYPNATAVFDTDAVGLMKIVQRMNAGTDLAGTSIGAPTQFAFGCGVNPTAEDMDAEFEYVRRKLDAGPQFLMTQPVFETDCWKRFAERLGGISNIPVLMGILPLQSYRHSEFLHNEVPGIHIPDSVRSRMHSAGNDGQRVGVELGRELLDDCRSLANGVYLMPSFGRFENCLELIRR